MSVFEKLQDRKVTVSVVLVVLALLLIIFDKYLIPFINLAEKQSRNITISDIVSLDSGIDEILDNYGIKKEWRHKQLFQITNSFSRYERVIYIPYHIPVININHDIKALAEKFNAKTSSSENIKNQILSIFINYRDNVVESIKFVTDISLERNVGKISICFSNFENLHQMMQLVILESPLFHSFILNPDIENSKNIKSFLKFNKEYFVLIKISINSEDKKYEFSSEMDSMMVIKQIKSIFRSHEKLSGLIYQAENQNDKVVSLLINETRRMNKMIFNFNDLFVLESSEDGFSNFDKLMAQVSEVEKSIATCILKSENIKKTQEDLLNTQKKGIKFITFKQFLSEEN